MVFKLQGNLLNKISIVFGGLAGYYILSDEKRAQLSWTSNHTPSLRWDWNWDRRDPVSLAKPSKKSLEDNEKIENCKSTASRHLIFIRHGQYNLDGASDEERILTQKGREQAALTGKRLRELNLNYSRFVHSTMSRAKETAEIILKYLEGIETVEKCDLLREGAPIPPEPPVGSWKAEMHKFYVDGARIEAGFRKYFHRAPPSQTNTSYEVYVCHANVIRYFICRALQLPPEAWLRMSLHNASITYIAIRPDGRVSLKQLGDCGHISTNLLTFN